jgi:hypothetical protein
MRTMITIRAIFTSVIVALSAPFHHQATAEDLSAHINKFRSQIITKFGMRWWHIVHTYNASTAIISEKDETYGDLTNVSGSLPRGVNNYVMMVEKTSDRILFMCVRTDNNKRTTWALSDGSSITTVPGREHGSACEHWRAALRTLDSGD